MKRHRAAAFVAVAAVVALAACSSSTSNTIQGQVHDPGIDVSTIALPNPATGTDQSFVAPKGDVQVVYFGYTSCPDICPTTLADLQMALESIGRDANRVQFTMVTIDPRRDTGPILGKYVEHFLKRADVRRTDDDQRLRAAAKAFGAQYSVQIAADGTEEVGHSAFLYAVDEKGRIVVTWPFGVDPKELASDLRILVDRARR